MKKIFGILLVAGVVLSSCNLPASGAPDPQIATFAALTVQAAINESVGTQQPQSLASPTNGNSGSATATPTYSKPFVSVSDVTNCRTGPGVDYERVTQLLPATSVEIIGFFPPNYWIVSTSDGECWVSGEFTTPVGSYTTVPTVTAPPTPQGGIPENVSLQKWDISCDYINNTADISIRWTDKDGESGYRIIRNEEMVVELAANSAEFRETISLLAGQSVSYSIVAYNSAGSNASKTITLSC